MYKSSVGSFVGCARPRYTTSEGTYLFTCMTGRLRNECGEKRVASAHEICQ